MRGHVPRQEHVPTRVYEERRGEPLSLEVEDPVRGAHERLAPDLADLLQVLGVGLEHVAHLDDDRAGDVGDVDPLVVVGTADLEALGGILLTSAVAARRRQEGPPVDVGMPCGTNAPVGLFLVDSGVVKGPEQVVPALDHLHEVLAIQPEVRRHQARDTEAQALHGAEERHRLPAEVGHLVGPVLAVTVGVVEALVVLELVTQRPLDTRQHEPVVPGLARVLVLGEHGVGVGEDLLCRTVERLDLVLGDTVVREGRDPEYGERVAELLARERVVQVHDRDPAGAGGGSTTGTLTLNRLCVTHGSPPVSAF